MFSKTGKPQLESKHVETFTSSPRRVTHKVIHLDCEIMFCELCVVYSYALTTIVSNPL